jgi:pimeloyl-ACP methyl ester carboxylesterase
VAAGTPRAGDSSALLGADASQWRYLAEALECRYEVLAPEHFGCKTSGPWTGEHAFALADEAARAIALIDNSEEKVHLVGHSYGGGVALHVALARPDRQHGALRAIGIPPAATDARGRVPRPTRRSPGLRGAFATGW